MNFGVVLVSPKYPGNVGAVLRLMGNFNIKTLHIVDPRVDLQDTALLSMAAGGEKRVKIKVFASLPEALRPFHVVLATSSGRGRKKVVLKDVAAMPRFLEALPGSSRVALLFGAEDRGLSQEEMSLAHEVFHIPVHRTFSVMNLAQAAAVVLFEATRLQFRGPREERVLADEKTLQGFFTHLREVLLDIEFLHENNPDRIMRDLKGMVLRALLAPREVLILRGILRQVRNYPTVLKARKNARTRDA